MFIFFILDYQQKKLIEYFNFKIPTFLLRKENILACLLNVSTSEDLSFCPNKIKTYGKKYSCI